MYYIFIKIDKCVSVVVLGVIHGIKPIDIIKYLSHSNPLFLNFKTFL